MGTDNVRTFSLRGSAALVATLALLSGCAEAPVQMMSDTRQTISAAEAAGASITVVTAGTVRSVATTPGTLSTPRQTWRASSAVLPLRE